MSQADWTKLSNRQVGGTYCSLTKGSSRKNSEHISTVCWLYTMNCVLLPRRESNVNCTEYLGFPIRTKNVLNALLCLLLYFSTWSSFTTSSSFSPVTMELRAASQPSFNSGSWEISLYFNESKGQSRCEILLDVWERLIFRFSLFTG